MGQDEIRSRFSEAMSRMYREEVPLYGDLLEIVEATNARVLRETPGLKADLAGREEIERLDQERHGAIRLGAPAELSMMRRALAVLGLRPVGYYDLTVAGVPVHATAFRPTDQGSLNRNPFRIFTSLLRLELIEDLELRAQAAALLASRRIFSDRAVALTEQFEREGGLDAASASDFVAALLETFRWQGTARVDRATYHQLLQVHRLVADVASFGNPHINHLTPRVLDIDAAQAEMRARGIDAKAVIEGPPRRAAPILLRQTSFKALEEPIRFQGKGGEAKGTHTARFGEIEQRGIALTRAGRALYDRLLDTARGEQGSQGSDFEHRLAAAFAVFPDDWDTLRREGLGFFHYRVVDGSAPPADDVIDLEGLIASGAVEALPIVYEDFLPVSAAGIFQSNLSGGEQRAYSATAAQAAFEDALGAPVLDPFALYEATEQRSIADVAARFPALARAQAA